MEMRTRAKITFENGFATVERVGIEKQIYNLTNNEQARTFFDVTDFLGLGLQVLLYLIEKSPTHPLVNALYDEMLKLANSTGFRSEDFPALFVRAVTKHRDPITLEI